ncbi:MAG: TonB-dependent receptor [Bacteroidales bacterium]|nr:TonB-dependent receptor [Bacteroidales bacterium]
MKKTLYISLFFTLLSLSAAAQVKGRVTNAAKQPLPFASVFWTGTQHNHFTQTAADGTFSIDYCADEMQDKLVVSSFGYESDTIIITDRETPLSIVLAQTATALGGVEVTAQQMSTSTMRGAVVHSVKLHKDELSKAACCNLSESFETNASVDVSVTDAATGAKQIKLLGLSGRYVQMLTENTPNFRGIAAPFSLSYVPGAWIESISISKGTSSVANGYEAITGQINVEFLKPQRSNPLEVNLYLNDEERTEMNLTSALKVNEHLSTGVFAHVSHDTQQHDSNGDNFLDRPTMKQYNLMNRWNYEHDRYHGQIGLHYINENRQSGQLRTVANPYEINIETERFNAFSKHGYILNPEHRTSLALILTASSHDMKSTYATARRYDGLQKNGYANAIFATELGEHHFLNTGVSFNTDNYRESAAGQEWAYNNNSTEHTVGAFAEYTLNLHEKFVALAGLRADHSSRFGMFVTPRVHLKYNLANKLYLRSSVGKGYRTAVILAENNNVLASNRTLHFDSNMQQEEAWNYGMSAVAHIPTIHKRELILSAEYYYTNFEQQVVVNMDRNAHEVWFENLDGNRSYASSMQFEAAQEVLKGWTVTAAHRITHTRQTIDGELREVPLTSRYKSMLSTSYATPKRSWQFDFTAQFNGGGRMPTPDAENPLWNDRFKPYTVLLGQITKYFDKWSVFAGTENMTGFMQKNPVIAPENPLSDPNFDASMVWGPLSGRMLYIGLKLRIE